MLKFTMLDPRVTDEHLGLIPFFLSDQDERKAVEQIHENYAHGGGWRDLKVGTGGFTLDASGCLKYPGDPKMRPYAEAMLHDCGTPEHKGERIMIYESGIVAIVQGDNSYRVSRLD